MFDALSRALGPRAEVEPAADGAAPVPPPAPAPPAAPGPTASVGARVAGLVLLLAALLVAILIDGEDQAFAPEEGFVLFAGFYVAAQAVERIFEFILPPGTGTPQARADRVPILGGLATVAGVVLSLVLGLRFVAAVDVSDPPEWLDVFLTGVIIGAGTKPLHDLISRIEKKKDSAI
jgi:hypothetical protein